MAPFLPHFPVLALSIPLSTSGPLKETYVLLHTALSQARGWPCTLLASCTSAWHRHTLSTGSHSVCCDQFSLYPLSEPYTEPQDLCKRCKSDRVSLCQNPMMALWCLNVSLAYRVPIRMHWMKEWRHACLLVFCLSPKFISCPDISPLYYHVIISLFPPHRIDYKLP
jgi:hypothetical protein